MELQFEKKNLSCLRCLADPVLSREETGEIRLPEDLPDAASVVATWGQVILRGKEWRTGGMSTSCGVTVWVLYSSEETGEMYCVDTYLPFQFKTDFPDPGRDGQICAWGSLDSMDARVVSARKIMVRANMTLSCRAWVQEKISCPQAGEVPDDVQLKENTYPVTLCREAGEQNFALEETLSVPEMEQWIYYTLSPKITEQKVMGDKLVYRGQCRVHMLGRSGGKLQFWEGEMPFSQFAELENSYEQEAQGYLIPMVTAVELSRTEEGKALMKCALSCQYIILDRQMLTIAEDGYSIYREAKPVTEEMNLPCVLQMQNRESTVTCAVDRDGLQVLDITMQACPGWLDRGEGVYKMPLWSQVLYVDPEGKIRGESCRWEETIALPAGENVRPGIYGETGDLAVSSIGGKTQISGKLYLSEMSDTLWEMPVLFGLSLGEIQAKDPNRPSLILRRMGEDGLWELAKTCRTTVSAIQSANNLSAEPTVNQMLIIPIN